MFRKFPFWVGLAGCVALLSGCATITRGTTEILVIETTPPGADVDLSSGLRCKTPCSLEMKHKNAVVLDISKQGYEPQRVNVLSEVAGAGAAGMAGNVILGGVIGAGIDVATGATKRLKPNPVVVTLVPIASTETAPKASSADNSDAALDKSQHRCVSIGFKEGTDEYRSCVMDQLKNIGSQN